MTLLLTGGVSFIGVNFVLDWLAASNEAFINFDKLTYAEIPRRWPVCKAMPATSWGKAISVTALR